MCEKLEQLVSDYGFEDALEMGESAIMDSVCPGICMNEGCDYSTEVEPDEKVAGLSSGEYYANAVEWWHELTAELFHEGWLPRFEDCPVFHNDEGTGMVIIEENGEEMGRVRYTYYHMPQSGNWEIVCYVT